MTFEIHVDGHTYNVDMGIRSMADVDREIRERDHNSNVWGSSDNRNNFRYTSRADPATELAAAKRFWGGVLLFWGTLFAYGLAESTYKFFTEPETAIHQQHYTDPRWMLRDAYRADAPQIGKRSYSRTGQPKESSEALAKKLMCSPKLTCYEMWYELRVPK